MGNTQYLKCNDCGALIAVEDIKLDCEIVSKDVKLSDSNETEKWVAIKYLFRCHKCGHEYTCFYRDRIVNDLFSKGKVEEAQERMLLLWEVFENE